MVGPFIPQPIKGTSGAQLRGEEEGASMNRYKKDSYYWYQEVIRTNGANLSDRGQDNQG